MAEQDGTVIAVRLRYPLAERLLLGPELLVLGNRVAAGLVGSDQVVYQRLRLAAGALGRPYTVWIEAEHFDINHRASLTMGVHRYFSARAARSV